MKYLQFSFPGMDRIRCVFGTRLGGISSGNFSSGNISFEVGDEENNVLNNRQALQKELGFERLVELNQVHGTKIHFDLSGDFLQGSDLRGDGAGTSCPGAAVLIKTADCQPIFLAHESGKFVCGLHVGWRGNRAGFPGTGVADFCARYRLSPGELTAVRGPSLGPCCARFDRLDEHWTSDYSRYYDPRLGTMDLWSLTRDQLLEAGVRPEKIFSLDLCTRCREDLFFSYRKAKTCGRQGSLIMIF
ncbi:polyphenol oxidase family protein [Desulfonatronovibrio hydrogenovorans]|uniref:polyphenol oxidase family protein n=1 Tax=Desulfonatronovibrio hydrogenovorans TaxID=53245 RepID=UPI000AD274DA|nr:polyphenol oxidase family protein [Desulfonatronovibrio hydrogenovorans]